MVFCAQIGLVMVANSGLDAMLRSWSESVLILSQNNAYHRQVQVYMLQQTSAVWHPCIQDFKVT